MGLVGYRLIRYAISVYLLLFFVWDVVFTENARVILSLVESLCERAMINDVASHRLGGYETTTTCVFFRVVLGPALTLPSSICLHRDMSKDDSEDISR